MRLEMLWQPIEQSRPRTAMNRVVVSQAQKSQLDDDHN